MKTVTLKKNKQRISPWKRLTARAMVSLFLFSYLFTPIAQAKSNNHMLRQQSASIVGEPSSERLDNKVAEIAQQLGVEISIKKENSVTNIFEKISFSLSGIAQKAVLFVRKLFAKGNNLQHIFSSGAAFHEGEIDDELEDILKFIIKYAITTGDAYRFFPPKHQYAGDIKIEELDWHKSKNDEKYHFYHKESRDNPWGKIVEALEYLPETVKKAVTDKDHIVIRLNENVNYALAWKLYKLVYKGDLNSKEEFLETLKGKGLGNEEVEANSIEAWKALIDLVNFLHAQMRRANYVSDPYRRASKNARERLFRIYEWVGKHPDIDFYATERDTYVLVTKTKKELDLEEYLLNYMKEKLKEKGPEPKNGSSIISNDQKQFLMLAKEQLWQLSRLGNKRGAIYQTEESFDSMSAHELAQLYGHEGAHIIWAEKWKVLAGVPFGALINFVATGTNGSLNLEDKVGWKIGRDSLLNFIRSLGYRENDDVFWEEAKKHEFSKEEARIMVQLWKQKTTESKPDPDKWKDYLRMVLNASEESAIEMEAQVREVYHKKQKLLNEKAQPPISLRERLNALVEKLEGEVSNKMRINKYSIDKGIESGLAKFLIDYHTASERAYYVWKKVPPKKGTLIIPRADIKKIVGHMDYVERYIREALSFIVINDQNLKERIEQSNLVIIQSRQEVVNDFVNASILERYLRQGNEEEFIDMFTGLTNENRHKALNLIRRMYEGQIRGSYFGSKDALVASADESAQRIILWLANHRNMGIEFSVASTKIISATIIVLEGFKLASIDKKLIAEKYSPEAILKNTPNYDELNFAPYLKKYMTPEVYEREKMIFYDEIFPSMVESWKQEWENSLKQKADEMSAQGSVPIVGNPATDSAKKQDKSRLLYYDFSVEDSIWLAMCADGSTTYISEGLWEAVRDNPLALLQLLAVGVYGEEGEDIIYKHFETNHFPKIEGETVKNLKTLREILEEVHPEIKQSTEDLEVRWQPSSKPEEVLAVQGSLQTQKADGVDNARLSEREKEQKILTFVKTKEGRAFLVEIGISEKQIDLLLSFLGEQKLSVFTQEQLRKLRIKLGIAVKDDLSFYGEDHTENVWEPILRNLYGLKKSNITVWNNFLTALREAGFDGIAEELSVIDNDDELIGYAYPLQSSFEGWKAVIESAGLIVNRSLEYASTWDEVKKKLGVEMDIVEVRGPPIPDMDPHQFVARSEDKDNNLKVAIHEEEIKAHQHHLAQYLAEVSSHETLENMGMHHDKVSVWFSEDKLKEHSQMTLEEIAALFKLVRNTFQLEVSDAVKMTQTYQFLSNSIQENRSNLFVVPSFLRQLFLPSIKELIAQGNGQPIFIAAPMDEDRFESVTTIEKDLKRTLGENWSDYVKIVKVPFEKGKFDSTELKGVIQKTGGDKSVTLIGGKRFWTGLEGLMTELVVRLLEIDFVKGSEMDQWIDNILKNSGMTEEMRLRMKNWAHPTDLIQQISNLNQTIQSFHTSQ